MKATTGPLAVFAVRSDGVLGRTTRPAPGAGFSDWEEAGVAVQSAPVAVENPDGRSEVFARGPSGRLGHFWQWNADDPQDFSEWDELAPRGERGPEIRLEPAAFPNADGRLEVFAIGPDGCLGHAWQHVPGGRPDGWCEWASFGHAIRSAPAACRNGTEFIEVFAIGPDGCLGHVWQRRGLHGGTDWSDWASFGWTIQSQPSVCRKADGVLEVFAIGSDGCLGHIWQQRDASWAMGWSTWGSFGHAIQCPPAVLLTFDGRLEVFAIGPDGCLGHVWQYLDPGGMLTWSDWESFGFEVQSPPAVCVNSDWRVEVFAAGPDGLLGHLMQREPGYTSGWTDWEDIGPAISGHRPAISPNPALVGAEQGANVPAPTRPERKLKAPRRLGADVCVIGAGPAGIIVADGLVRAGAEVILLESGDWNEDPEVQTLNYGDADGPIIKGHLKYLREGRLRRVQGSAAVWGRGWCMPFRPIDFERRSWVPLSGWPLRAGEHATYEQRAAETFGFEPFAAPIPEGSLIRMSYHYPRDPLLFRAKLVALLNEPRFRLELDATAVELDVIGDRVESVRCARLAGGDLRVTAGTVVLAAGGVENARLLLLNERSLTAAAAMAGRCFMDHPHVLAGTVRLGDPAPLRSYFDINGGQATLDVLALPDEAQLGERLLNATVQLRPLAPGVDDDRSVECELYVRSEQAPNPDSRVSLGQRLDRFGCPRPSLRWEMLEQDWTTVVRTTELVAGALEHRYGADATVAIHSDAPWPMAPANPLFSHHGAWGNHHMGTTRVAIDPAEGVVDDDCLVHGTSNLYVAGSSLFPTGGCANPTFMIVALAHRLVDHLAAGMPAGLRAGTGVSPQAAGGA